MDIQKALEEIRKQNAEKEVKFDQSVDLIVNLRKIDIRKNQINLLVNLPHKIKDKKICGFIEGKTSLVDTIPKAKFIGYKDKKKVKKLVKKYDFFIASGPNMPSVATTFGRVLGPAGKMPSPKLGILMVENDENIKALVERINKTAKIQAKEPSIKLTIGKQKMADEDIAANVKAVYKKILKELPNQNDNIRSILLKFTMGKPVKVEM